MKLEEILPEIRKGRKIRMAGERVYADVRYHTVSELLDSALELEPLPEKKVEITYTQLANLWDWAVFGTVRIEAANTSPVFARLAESFGLEKPCE